MKLSQFKYRLPQELIALYPAKNRDESRLMIVDRKTGKIGHRIFKEIIEYFSENDLLVFNNTKVFPARLFGNKEKTGAEIEVFLLRELNREQRLWDVLVDPARKIRIGNKLYFGQDDILVAEVIDNTTSRGRTLRFLYDGSYEEFKNTLYSLGETPLPKFIERPVEPEDHERYQTIFAKHEGAVAAPTAGLHFTKQLLNKIKNKGIKIAKVTLNVGFGTFLPIRTEEITEHKMHPEYFEIDKKNAEIINNCKGRLIVVGTTTLRALESASKNNKTYPKKGYTEIFIYPGYKFRSKVKYLITNFHLPKSSLLILVSAFAGTKNILKAYKEAVTKKYRFYSFGDAMLLSKKE